MSCAPTRSTWASARSGRTSRLMNDSIPEILTDRALRRAARDCVVLAGRDQVPDGGPGLRLRHRAGHDAHHRRRGGRDGRRPRCGRRRRGRDRLMTTPIVPREIAEGPDAIRQTVETAWPAARDIAGAPAARRDPPDPRDRQRDLVPLEPRRGGALRPARGRGRPGRRPGDRRRVPRLPARPRPTATRSSASRRPASSGTSSRSPRRGGAGCRSSASSTCPGSTLTRVASESSCRRAARATCRS